MTCRDGAGDLVVVVRLPLSFRQQSVGLKNRKILQAKMVNLI